MSILNRVNHKLFMRGFNPCPTMKSMTADAYTAMEDRLEIVATVIEAQLVFKLVLNNSTGEHHIVYPRILTDYYLIGYKECEDCNDIWQKIIDIDHITLGYGGDVERKIRLQTKDLLKKGTLVPEFPYLLAKNGADIIYKATLIALFGITKNEE